MQLEVNMVEVDARRIGSVEEGRPNRTQSGTGQIDCSPGCRGVTVCRQCRVPESVHTGAVFRWQISSEGTMLDAIHSNVLPGNRSGCWQGDGGT
jgi:hypothetical protein